MSPGRRRIQTLVDAAALIGTVWFIASFFPAELIFSPTTTNGGDTSSHVYAAAYMRDVLLPQGKVAGWCPGNYAGFPIFQFYFPLPFVLMAGLSSMMPLLVAFKVVSILGTFLLPPAAYLALRLSRVPFPGPALGAIFCLPFLFMEANSMWGGNIPSTLAGEITFSLSVAVFVLFIGTLRYTMTTGRGAAWNGLVVAIGGLCHGYALLWAGVVSLTELLLGARWAQQLRTLVVVHGLAILLMAFWLLPLIVYTPWTTGFAHVWLIYSIKEIVPPVLWPAVTLALGSSVALVVRAVRGGETFPPALSKLWAAALIGLGMYYAGRTIHVVDIRFLPFFQLGLGLLAAAGLGYLVARLPVPEIWPLVALLTVLPWVGGGTKFIESWVRWNFAGYEQKPTWPVLKKISDHLRGGIADPRVVYEHSNDHEALGTTRVFENLPLFAGRSTLEGLYMQASPSAPFVFFVQSEISREQSCPFGEFGCSRFDLARGIEHLRMFNVSQFIVRSDEVKAAAAAHPRLTREVAIGDYEIYRLEDNDGRHAVALPLRPYLILTQDWKDIAYRWFKRAGPSDPLPVFAQSASEEERKQFSAVVTSLPDAPPSKALPGAPPLVEQMGNDRVVVTGCRPGHPILIRVSFHPRWQVTTGERIWLAGPSFMLVFPRTERLELRFGDGPPVVLGRWLSVVGLLLLLLGVTPVGRRLAPRVVTWRPIAALESFVRRAELSRGLHRRLVVGVLVGGSLGFVAAGVMARRSDADTNYRLGQRVYDDKSRGERQRLGEALPHFQRAQQLSPLSATAINSSYYQSIILFRLERWVEAERSFQDLLDGFPEAHAAAEAQYHVGICRARRGQEAAAIEAWRQVPRLYPGTPWARYASDRLSEHGAR